jgi:hypothetical protein
MSDLVGVQEVRREKCVIELADINPSMESEMPIAAQKQSLWYITSSSSS